MPHRIFIVEDEPDLRDTLSFNFENEGFKVSSFPDGEKCLTSVKKNKPDLIILDLMLPGINGLDVCREIRSKEENNDVSIIMLTAKGEEIDIIVGFELGADDYVTKPFSVRELILRVKAILKRGSEKKEILEVVRQFGDLKLDIDSHEVHVDNVEINLTALEFKLLRQLVDTRGRVQSRDKLLSEVWGYSSEVTTRTVDTHIKRLREKLGPMGKYVQTIRGVGYKFARSLD